MKTTLILKSIVLFVAVTTICYNAYAQDVIYFQDGSELKTKILEVKSEIITYKKSSNPSGPTYESLKSTIFKIIYQNGTVEIITPENNDGKTGIVFKFIGNDSLQVIAVTEQGPGSLAGVLVGDKIVKIGNVSVGKFGTEANVQDLLDGPVGSTVDITIVRNKMKNQLLLTVERELPPVKVIEVVTVEKDTVKKNDTEEKKIISNEKTNPPRRIITESKHLIGFQVGPTISTTVFSSPGLSPEYGPIARYHVGFYYNFNFKPGFSLRTALNFSGTGAVTTSASYSGVLFQMNYMDIYAGVQINFAKPHKLQPYLHFGPVLSVLLNGRTTFPSGNITNFSEDAPNAYASVTIGANVGFGAKWNIWKNLFISGEYQMYLTLSNAEGEDAVEGQSTRWFTIGSFLFGAGWMLGK